MFIHSHIYIIAKKHVRQTDKLVSNKYLMSVHFYLPGNIEFD